MLLFCSMFSIFMYMYIKIMWETVGSKWFTVVLPENSTGKDTCNEKFAEKNI